MTVATNYYNDLIKWYCTICKTQIYYEVIKNKIHLMALKQGTILLFFDMNI